MVLLKKFLIALAVTLYVVAPVFAGDSDRVRGHWQWQGSKMLDLTADQQTMWARLKMDHLEDIQASAQDCRSMKKRFLITFQSSAGKEGLISHYKREYQIAVGRSPTWDHRLLMGVPSNRFCSSQSKGSRKNWRQGHGKNSNKCHDMGRSKDSRKNWRQGHGKNSNKCHDMGRRKDSGMRWDKGASERRDRSRGDKWQKYRKKKSFDSD